ncbi:MAG: polysulfide reductase [Pirellulaceae bacterium]|nr:MAG: polysulfide reductase [Pirellulaceae bacterium]
MNARTRLVILLLTGLSIPGLFGLIWRARTGLVHTDLSNHVVWGLWVAMYIYFLGLSAGGFVLSSLVYGFRIQRLERVGKLAVLQAFVCMLVGVTFIWIDLGHPARFIYVLFSPNPASLLSWEAFVYLIYLFILLVELSILRPVESADELPVTRQRLLTVLALVGIPAAIGVHWGTGALFAVVKARPEWNTGVTPVAFLASAAASGAGLLMVLATLFGQKDEEDKATMDFLAKLTAGILVLDALLLVSEALVVWYGGVEHDVAAYRHLYFGPYWPVTWILHAGLGLVIPLFLFMTPRLRRNRAVLTFGAMSVVLGVAGYRLNIVIPAQIDAPFHELVTAYYHVRNIPEYFPSLMEWLVSLGVIAGGCWLFWCAWMVLGHRPAGQTECAALGTSAATR